MYLRCHFISESVAAILFSLVGCSAQVICGRERGRSCERRGVRSVVVTTIFTGNQCGGLECSAVRASHNITTSTQPLPSHTHTCTLHTYVHAHIHTDAHMQHTHTHKHTYCTHTHILSHAHTCTHTHTQGCTHTCTHVHTCTRSHVHTHTRTYTKACTHNRTQRRHTPTHIVLYMRAVKLGGICVGKTHAIWTHTHTRTRTRTC